MCRAAVSLALAVALGAVAVAVPAARADGLELGFFDGQAGVAGPDGSARLDEAVRAGARSMRVAVTWPAIAPTKPANPADPADPAYRWAATDAVVAAVRARGLQVLLSIDQAAPWAQATSRPRKYRDGAWKPDPQAVGDFATAVARRYAGQATALQLWNEPNLNTYLAPQWERKGGRWRPVGPDRYRAMLNAAYPGVHAAGMLLVTGGTAPYGDPGAGGGRIMPVRFWRRVLSRTVRFDVLAHHPYGVGGPFDSAPNADDVAVPDIGKLKRLVHAAERRGTAPAAHGHRFWVTEMSWDSAPDPDGLPQATQARWLAEALYELWREGVDQVFWFQVRDQAPGTDYGSTNQSGVYELDGTPKPSEAAFAFPLVCRRRAGRTMVWALAPRGGGVMIVDRLGRSRLWLGVGRDRIVSGSVSGRGPFTAVQQGTRSLTCSG